MKHLLSVAAILASVAFFCFITHAAPPPENNRTTVSGNPVLADWQNIRPTPGNQIRVMVYEGGKVFSEGVANSEVWFMPAGQRVAYAFAAPDGGIYRCVIFPGAGPVTITEEAKPK